MTSSNDTNITDVSVLFRQAAACYQQGNLVAAADLVRRIFDASPGHADANHLAGLVAIQHGQYEYAVDAVARAIESSPLIPMYHYNFGVALFALGRQEAGLVGAAFSTLANRLDGVDLSTGMLAKARERGIYTDLIEKDVCHALEKLNHSYDLILSADVFIYIGDLDEVFSLATKRMHGGSLFAFSIEVIEGDKNYCLDYTGRYRQSLDYIQRLAQAYGLENVHCAPVIVRTENDKPVGGYIVVLRLPYTSKG